METLILALAISTDPSPRGAAALQRELAKAHAAIDARNGHKKPAELPNEARLALIRAHAEAERRVLEAHGVSARDWVRSEARRDRASRAEVRRELAVLAETEASVEAKKVEDGEAITVQRGFGEQSPVTLEEAPAQDTPVTIERRLPPEVQDETDLLAEHDRLEASGGVKGAATQRKTGTEKGH